MLVCIDEAQIAYDVERTGSTSFWNQLKSLGAAPGILTPAHDTRVVLTAAYGSSVAYAEPDSPTPFPVNFQFPKMVVTIFPGPSEASLRLTDAEWTELWDSFITSTGLHVGNCIKDHIGSICSVQVCSSWVVRYWRLWSICCISCCACPSILFARALTRSLVGAAWAADGLPRLPSR